MKLLLDQNLPPRLVDAVSAVYPGSEHVAGAGLDRADDRTVADYAREHGYAVVTKDADFAELAHGGGAGLKVIWLRLGNCTTAEIEAVLLGSRDAIASLDDDPDARVLSLE